MISPMKITGVWCLWGQEHDKSEAVMYVWGL